ncbi:TniQ family protein [Lysobacter sp. CA199]|uniref:TniQ family protein n=1 Tax=Lysobacter sp. CA199 TaxID=3455608 RepID=UPI003F8D080E
MRWPFPLVPQVDELLSSFLVRASHLHGLAPYRFCAYHFPNIPIWNRDIDRSAPDALLIAIAEKADLPWEQVVGMTLRSAATTLGSDVEGNSPWINAVGVYHRLRRRWGQQYCPACLIEHPVFYRSWRLSFVVTCRRHQVRLQDACPHCDVPLAIHRQQLSACLCHACSLPLSRKAADSPLSARALWLAQSRWEHALTDNHAMISRARIPAQALFQGARVLMNLIKPSGSIGPKTHSVTMELARVEKRAEVLLHLERLIEQWPDGFSAAARQRHLTQRSFVRWSLPDWLGTVVDQLPRGNSRAGAAHRGTNSIRARLEASRRQGGAWRTARAELLWRAANP